MDTKEFHPFEKQGLPDLPVHPEQAMRKLLEEKQKLDAKEQEKIKDTDVVPEQIITALFRGDEAVQKLFKDHPRFRTSVERTRWNNRFVSMVESGNYYLKQILARFLFEPEVRKTVNLGLAYHGVAGEVMAQQLLKRSGLVVAHARPEIDAVCGIDFLAYKTLPGGTKKYMAVQIKTSPYHREPTVSKIDEHYVHSMREKSARSRDEEETLESVTKCLKATAIMTKLSQKEYMPFLLEIPSVNVMKDKINLGTFQLPPAIVDVWVKKMVPMD